MVIVMDLPASIVKGGAGAPSAANGASGRPTDSIVSGAPPTLRNVAAADTLSPTAVGSKAITVGVASSCASAARPVPDSETLPVLPAVVLATKVAPEAPCPSV